MKFCCLAFGVPIYQHTMSF